MVKFIRKFVLKAVFVQTVILAAAFVVIAQPGPVPSGTPTDAQEARKMINQREAANRRFEAMRNAGKHGNDRRKVAIYFETIRDFYRNPTREEAKLLEPNSEDSKKYEKFLKTGNAGLTRLIDDMGCSDNSIIIVASEECLKYSMPGGGSSFSFRTENYRIWRLADVTYSGGKFRSLGVLSQGILVDLGDLPLETVSLMTPGMKFLKSFQPLTEFTEAKQTDRRFIDGIEAEGFLYSRSASSLDERTYALRSVAYRGSVLKSYQGITYNELEFDNRKDVIVVFRIVRREDHSVTILWKELDRINSPKIKTPAKVYDN